MPKLTSGRPFKQTAVSFLPFLKNISVFTFGRVDLSWDTGSSLLAGCGPLFSCGMWAQLPLGVWFWVPRPGIKPVSPALDGRGKCLLFVLPSRLRQPWSYRPSLCSPSPTQNLSFPRSSFWWEMVFKNQRLRDRCANWCFTLVLAISL